MPTVLALLLLLLLPAAPASAAEEDIALPDGPGREAVERNCAACHSLDYIPMNHPIFDRDGWRKEVDKMINAMGAPISPEDAETITVWLARNFSSK